MQKLDQRDTYTPPNTAPVRCNCDPVLKVPRGKDGVQDLKTLSNISEEHLLVRQLQDERNMLYSSQKLPYNPQEN